MSKLKKIFTNFRVVIALLFILFAIVAIHPNPLVSGVAIRSVTVNSSASIAGIESPKPTATPMSRERITAINNFQITNIQDYYGALSKINLERTVSVKTNKASYNLVPKEKFETVILNGTETKTITEEVFDEKTNLTKNVTKKVTVNKTQMVSAGFEDIGLNVFDAPTTNIRKGLDLQGGTRVLLQPQEELSADEMAILIENMKYRLNVYGLSDITVRDAGDLSGNQYIVVEIAGAKEEEVRELLAKQGKFEASVGNVTVFKGGNDITYVCRSSECSGIDPMRGCGQSSDGQWYCTFRFSISLSPEAAQRQADATKDLDIITEGSNEYLSEKLILYLDDSPVDELNIGSDLRGKAATEISISGSGAGAMQQEAVYNTLANMKRLQTVLITGSLPVKLDIVKTDTISAVSGEEFVKNAILVGLVALLGVALVISINYRRFKIIVPVVFTSISEVIIILGVAALIGWNLDLAAIAGIIVSVGTGVDHQIVITDEILKGESGTEIFDWKQKIKNAFSIIFASYTTTAIAMIPLWFAGAGLLRGFALTTLIGITIGVFIARPAFAAVIEILLKE